MIINIELNGLFCVCVRNEHKKTCIWNVMNVQSAFGNVMLLFRGIKIIIRKTFLKINNV